MRIVSPNAVFFIVFSPSTEPVSIFQWPFCSAFLIEAVKKFDLYMLN